MGGRAWPGNRANCVLVVLLAIYVCAVSARTGPAAVLPSASTDSKYVFETKEATVSAVAATVPNPTAKASAKAAVAAAEQESDAEEADTTIRTAASSVSWGKKKQKNYQSKQYGTAPPGELEDTKEAITTDSSSSDAGTDASADSTDAAANKDVKKTTQKTPSYPLRQEDDHHAGKKTHKGKHADKKYSRSHKHEEEEEDAAESEGETSDESLAKLLSDNEDDDVEGEGVQQTQTAPIPAPAAPAPQQVRSHH